MRFWFHLSLTGLLLASLGGSTRVSAQAPDIRNIRPHFMLLVDTSGSMERKPNCICTTPACLECLPVCSPGAYEQNRWSVVAQALTGEFSPYECNSDTRIGGIYAGEYDEGYFLPHIQLPQEIPTYIGSQGGNGVLDIYLERIKQRRFRSNRSAPRACTRTRTTARTRSPAQAAWSTCSTTERGPS
ncbi:MAG: hypothetical protein JRH14_21530 [Deltaproteobacteria bacterium]|nr:hypothetical protein [Deltaproteobacteria bacterium]